ncbi:IncA family protein [Chlamydia sp. 12-01]|uniref:IncA family protein n=1 Tax=Chlamydia sp. 12-01 TaxID=3002742 RepID=UPI0035D4D01D
MNFSLPLGLANTQQPTPSHYSINKPYIVYITSIIATILGLTMIAASIALLVLFGAQASAVFSGILVSIIIGVLLLLLIGGAHFTIIFKLAHIRRREILGFRNTFQEFQTKLQHLQNCLLEKENRIRDLQRQLDEEPTKLRDLLKLKEEELENLTRRYAAMAQERSDFEELIIRLRTELVELRKDLEENKETSNTIVERLRVNSELLYSESILARQAQQAEKIIADSLRTYCEELQAQLHRAMQTIQDKSQIIDKSTLKSSELRKEISDLQVYITDNIANREQKYDVIQELNEKLAALKTDIESLQEYITERTASNELELPMANNLTQRAHALHSNVSDIQELITNHIVIQPDDSQDRGDQH